MNNKIYIPIKSTSLAHYFSRAIILPAKYFSNKPEDIQNTVGDAILVSINKWVKNSDCTLEVVLTNAEVKKLNRVSDYLFLSNTPIPISRVKSVCFLDVKQKETTIWNINNGAAFIPESIVSIEKSANIEPISDSELKDINEFKSATELSDKIKRFDIVLGGFAFMRLGGKSFMNYAPNYFATLSYFNKLIEEQTNRAAKEKGFSFSDKYSGLFSKSESEWTKWQPYIYRNLEPHDIETIAEKVGERVEKKLGLLKIDSINPASHLYELAILATYGDGKQKSTDDMVTNLSNGTINRDKVEEVSMLFGLNNGYSKLRNKYKSSVKENWVKFTLESKLDYYIIESVFQFVFHGKVANRPFNYIDPWCPVNTSKQNVKGFETYKILDKVVIAKKRQTPLEIFLENYSSEIYSTIAKSINKWLPPFAKSNEKEAIQYYEKRLRSTLSVAVEALQRKVESECEANFNEKKREATETYQKEMDKLKIEISNLKKENALLIKKAKTSSFTDFTEPQTIKLQKSDSTEKEIEIEKNDPIGVVQEPIADNYKCYQSMSLRELKEIAKKKKLRGYTKKNKDDLIDLIIKAPPTLL